MTDFTPADRALHALDKAHAKQVGALFRVLIMAGSDKPEAAASRFRAGLENAEAAYLLAKHVISDVFGNSKPVT
jgi:hypothetical protein